MEIIKLNLIPSGVNPVCHCSQYDAGRVIRFELFDGLTPYTLSSEDEITLKVRKPDNTIVTAEVENTESNYIDIVTTEQMTACFGNNLGELNITTGEKVIGSLNFVMAIEKDPIANGDPSQSVIKDLDTLVLEETQEVLADYGLDRFPSDIYWVDNALYHKLHRNIEGIDTDFDVSELKPANEKTYYISPTGNDSNTGEDADHPLTKLSTAIAKADVKTIICADGIYNLGRVGGSFTKGINIIAAEGAHPIFIMSRDKTWSKTDGYNYIYETTDTASAFYGVIKANSRDADGDLLGYTLVESLADVESTENSYYVSGHSIYIHSESAPQKVYVLVSGVNIHATLSDGETLYIEGCEFIGGNYGGVRVTNGGTKKPLVLLKNCGFTKSYLGNALYLQGCSGILQDCYASRASDDGFNYHATNNVVPDTIEIRCIGRHNGTVGNNTNNGSTTHDGAKIIRLNCEYYDNIGPNLADVNNSLSFNYGVVSHDSNGASTNKSGFQCQGGIMWNDTCAAYNNDYNFQAYLGGELRQKNCSGSINLGENGKVRAY